jgi:hypothetical protein
MESDVTPNFFTQVKHLEHREKKNTPAFEGRSKIKNRRFMKVVEISYPPERAIINKNNYERNASTFARDLQPGAILHQKKSK